MAAKRKKKRRVTKYREIKFKLSERQKKSLERNCKARNTTPTKLIKKMIQAYLTLKLEDKPPDFTTPNQLDLFDEPELLIAAEPDNEKYESGLEKSDN